MVKGKSLFLFISILIIIMLALIKYSNMTSSAWALDLVYGDIVMDSTAESMKKGKVDAVLYPHWFHRIRFKCKVCHEKIFVSKKGKNKITMETISAGKHCGVCHDGKVSWDPLYCERCHVINMTDKTNKKDANKIESDGLIKTEMKNAPPTDNSVNSDQESEE